MELREQREQTPKANCFEAEGPEMKLHEQREQTPKANCVEAEGPEMKLHEQREQTPKADCVEAEGPEMHCPPVLWSGSSRWCVRWAQCTHYPSGGLHMTPLYVMTYLPNLERLAMSWHWRCSGSAQGSGRSAPCRC